MATTSHSDTRRVYILTHRSRKDQRPAGGRPAGEVITPDMIREATHKVVINSWEDREDFWYVGYSYVNPSEGNWGYVRLYKPGSVKPPFACSLERTTETHTLSAWKPFTPKPGDRGYDLMH